MRVTAEFYYAAAAFYFLTQYLFLCWFYTRKVCSSFCLIVSRVFCLSFPFPVYCLGNLQEYALSTKVYPHPVLKSD